MRTRMEVANSDFVAKLASYADKKAVEPMVITSAKNESKEKAIACATSYWMMGWHWDEIASVLEDSGFPEKDIDDAVRIAKEGVDAKLKEGPFSVLQFGQLVRLKSGDFGKLIDRRGDFVSLDVVKEQFSFIASQIDFERTAALTQAFALRAEAQQVLCKIADDLAKAPIDFRVKPDPEETSGKGYNWPKGVPQEDEATGEPLVVEDLLYLQQELDHSMVVAAQEMLELSRSIEQANTEIKEATQELNEQLSVVRQQKSEQETKLYKLVEEFLNTVEQTNDVTQQQYTYVMNFLNRIVILHQRLEEPLPRTDLKYIQEYKDFYQGMITWADSQPARIKEKMLTAMEEVKAEVITQPRSVWKRVFEIIWPTKEHRKTSQDMLAQIWDSVKGWVSKSFSAVQKYFDSWENDIKPDIEEQTAQVDEFIAQKDKLDQGEQAQGAVASLLKRYK
jgi:hypothetical protein